MRRLKQDRGDVNSVRVCMCIYLKETINFIPFVIYTRHKKPINRKRVWSWIYSLFQQTMTAESQTHTSIKQYAPIIHFSHTIPIGTEKWPPQNCLFERCSNKEPIFNLLKNINSSMSQNSYIKCWSYDRHQISNVCVEILQTTWLWTDNEQSVQKFALLQILPRWAKTSKNRWNYSSRTFSVTPDSLHYQIYYSFC